MSDKTQSIIDRVTYILRDDDHVRWTWPELSLWINDARNRVAELHPRVVADHRIITLQEGSRQDLRLIDPTTNWIRLYSLVCNVRDGKPTGPTIQVIDRNALDRAFSQWRGAPPTARDVQEFSLDDRDKYGFDVVPPVRAGVEVYAFVSAVPTAPIAVLNVNRDGLADSDEVTGLPPSYAIPMSDYVLYRCFTKDANDPTYASRAQTHLQAFTLEVQAEISDASGV